MKKETIYECFINKLCTNCANRDKDLCHIVRKINKSIGCEYYEKDKPIQGHKEPIKPFNHFRGETTRWF